MAMRELYALSGMHLKPRFEKGFTLIELSIVLVIIGLIVGGVLVGQSLVTAAAVRAQITQIEKFNTAANVFFSKYGYLPGDIPAGPALQFGFAARGQYAGEGDGNGIIEGVTADSAASDVAFGTSAGENVMFWEDLSKANLIEYNFWVASSHTVPSYAIYPTYQQSATYLSQYLPDAKIGNGNYIWVFSGQSYNNGWQHTGINYFSIENIGWLNSSGPSVTMGLTVQQSYAIDSKIDDGIPTTGRVQASYVQYLNSNYDWSNGSVNLGTPDTSATSGSATTCYDNGGVAGPQHYSMQVNGGTGVNCALSFRMQAGD